MKILFVCSHNRFRSKVAEALFKKYNKNKNIKVHSCGTDPDYIHVAKNVVKALNKFGIKRVNMRPRKINGKLVDNSNLIIIVANNINKNIFKKYKKKVIVRKIPDTSQHDYKGILERAKKIEKKIKMLVRSLK